MSEQPCAPNHHASYPRFAGPRGLLAALSMVIGRGGNARLAAELSGIGPGSLVVDVGCGPGVAVRHAARLGAQAVGIDPAPVMLRMAQRMTRRSLDVTYVEGTAEELPLLDGSASAVWSIATVHHWSDLDAGLREAFRVLRKGGRLIAIERRVRPGAHGHASHGWTDAQADEFASRSRDVGFNNAQCERTTSRRREVLTASSLKP